jgi:hypothetical protein
MICSAGFEGLVSQVWLLIFHAWVQEMHIEKLGRVVRAGNLLSFTGCRLNDIGTFQEFWSAEGHPWKRTTPPKNQPFWSELFLNLE